MAVPKHHKVSMHSWENGELKMTHFFLATLEEALKVAQQLHMEHGKHVKVYDADGQLSHSVGPEVQATYA